MYALDSDLLIAFLRGDKAAQQAVQRLEGARVTVLNAQELLVGARDERTREKVLRFLHAFPSTPYTIDDVSEVAIVRQELAKTGNQIGLMDEMIAGIVRANKMTIVTRNRKHFSRIKGLRVESW